MTTSYSRTDIASLASFLGAVNQIHLNEELATETMFEGRIAHGTLTESFISTALGAELPGPTYTYLSQNLRFLGPVRQSDTVHSQITITNVNAEKTAAAIHRLSRKRQPYLCRTDARRMQPE
jgi:3-hydroxybutyryl-CoA dehydratase